MQTEENQFKTKEEKEKHADEVRNEGLNMLAAKKDANQEIDLEIEAPGAANKVAEEGAQTIQNEEEYVNLKNQLEAARKNPANAIGEGGFMIALKDPKEFDNTIRVVVLDGPNKEESIKEDKFDTKDQYQTKQASYSMATTL